MPAFHRSGWRPWCNAELRDLEGVLVEMRAHGEMLVALSPLTPNASLPTAERPHLTFRVLSGQGNDVTTLYGPDFTLPGDPRSDHRDVTSTCLPH